MIKKDIVTSFLSTEGKILILKRSEKVSTYRGKWAGVSGYLEEGNSPYEQALIEISEETGLTEEDVEFVKTCEPIEVFDQALDTKWIIHLFHFKVKNPGKIKLDWEHKSSRWISPEELKDYDTVPGLKTAWEKIK